VRILGYGEEWMRRDMAELVRKEVVREYEEVIQCWRG
jgi:hypothetical protein